jgi:hypothetical protein
MKDTSTDNQLENNNNFYAMKQTVILSFPLCHLFLCFSMGNQSVNHSMKHSKCRPVVQK